MNFLSLDGPTRLGYLSGVAPYNVVPTPRVNVFEVKGTCVYLFAVSSHTRFRQWGRNILTYEIFQAL